MEPDREDSKNVWLSIVDFPRAKRCWLCAESFVKGKQKKIITVQEILQFYTTLISHSESVEVDGTLDAPVMYCWNEFFTNSGRVDDLLLKMSPFGVDVNTSTLVCTQTELCSELYAYIISLPKVNDISTLEGSPDPAVNLCPPGCGCDNPWPFLNK